MDIFLASPRGFCAGVQRAVEIVELAIKKYGPPIYVNHEIVHNITVISNLKKKGAIFVENIEKVPNNSIVIFSAHGVSNKIKKYSENHNLQVIDATCPLVTKVHKQVQKYEREGKEIILIGHKNHPEVEGTMGSINKKVHLIQNVQEIQDDNIPINKTADVAYVTQTTLSIDDTKEMIDILKNKFTNIEGPGLSDICYATQNRQEAVKILAQTVDIILVIGAQNSSNSNRLKDIALKFGKPSYLINDKNDINLNWLKNDSKIGITAGASAPESVVQELITFLGENFRIRSVQDIGSIKENVQFKLPEI